ncbi:MAG: short-chain dehydrogenase [Alphaproteobacteria bacterium]|nr:MAG: short-chain dehydrogenase [Alphaproteobacteria bacterium]
MTLKKENVAVVTGGSLGMGADICQRLLADGVTVINLSYEPAKFSHENLNNMNVDLTDRVATHAVAQEIARQYNVSRFIHCAGTVRPACLDDVKLDDLDYLTELHLGCAITLVQAFVPAMREAHFGRIILISSRGVLGLPTRTVYSATKGAMLSMARTWAMELADQGITVNTVAPGPVATELFLKFVPSPERQAEIAATVPVKRLGKAEDIGRVVHFLLEEDSSFITGQTMYICGGASLGTLTM